MYIAPLQISLATLPCLCAGLVPFSSPDGTGRRILAIADEIKKQEEIAKQSRLKIEKLKDKEAKRILRIADKAGFFSVEVSDETLAQAFTDLVKTARAPSAEPVSTA